MTDEVWKEINGYPSYMISNKGRVKNCYRNKILVNSPGSNGYMTVNLMRPGFKKSVTHPVHSLVGDAFIPNPDNLPVLNHKDEDKLNNCDWNLEWCTYQYNSEYSMGMSVSLVSPDGKVYDVTGIRRFAREHGLNQSHLSKLIAGKFKQHKGWTAWK